MKVLKNKIYANRKYIFDVRRVTPRIASIREIQHWINLVLIIVYQTNQHIGLSL